MYIGYQLWMDDERIDFAENFKEFVFDRRMKGEP
jgi:hypothetical protein